MTIHTVTDFASNEDEQIVRVAKMLSYGGARRALWQAVYRGKKAIKTVPELSKINGLNYLAVLNQGKYLHDHGFLIQVKEKGRVIGFRKYQYLDKSKKRILRLADNKKKREAVATKRNPVSKVT